MQGLLIVDDEEGVRRALHKALGKDDYQLFLAADGNQAISIVRERPGDIAIVISDFKMPGLDGLQTLVAIGSINPDITRIMLTGYATLESAIAATNEGIDGFLTKPFDNAELRAKVREYFIRRRLKQFVPASVLRELQHNPSALLPRRQTVSILFADIRGFSQLTGQHEPPVWAEHLSDHYFTPLGETIFRHNGTLDKHIGDSIMAIFGAPLAADDDGLRAVRTAVAIRDQMSVINARLDPALRLPVGVGVHTGEVMVGLFGSARKREYTALGQPVNVAQQLQKLARPGEVLISSDTYRQVQPAVYAEELPPSPLWGISEPLRAYRVLGLVA